ncbi:phosphomannomutase [Mesorhizobium sp. CN2-181]|uniref:phosphomannomutase n=1 Tax=Mesorhizobium yinganensis TaxID=3157707 RepID=UPI0032B74231
MVAFGTSGLRGLATDLLAGPAYAHVAAFASCLISGGRIAGGGRILVGCDRRDSSPDLTRQSLAALVQAGLHPVFCGVMPTPALACQGLALGAPAVMVTGSHIPPDRNGLKFYRPDGEIDKADERAIAALAHEFPDAGMPALGSLPDLPPPDGEALRSYAARYKTVFADPILKGRRIGVYRHSSVASDVLADLAAWLGAEVVPLGESGEFVAVDTEAIEPSTAERLENWSREYRLDSIVSTDGDGDRPLMTDEAGRVIRGDALGLVASLFLKADAVVTPVSSNPGITAGFGFEVIRTKVGSPYVLEEMDKAVAQGFKRVVGFEANGGLLLGTPVEVNGSILAALPTRDSILPILCAFSAANSAKLPLSNLVGKLALPACVSGRVENFARADSDRLMAKLRISTENIRVFLSDVGIVSRVEDIDGIQIYLEDGSMIHLRPSGNAPEMRCYASAPTGERAAALLQAGLSRIERFPGNNGAGD